MSRWMRLEAGFRSHPKILALARRLSIRRAEARGLMAGLWTYVLDQAPDGDLSDMDPIGIEEGAEWEGETGAFYRAASELRLLDLQDGVARVHDWMEFAGSFREAHKKAKLRRKTKCPPVVPGQSPDSPQNVPSDVDETRTRTRTNKIGVPKGTHAAGAASVSSDIDRVVDHYRSHHPRARPGKKERALISARLAEQHSVADLCRAIDGYHADAWHCGTNDRGRSYLDLSLLLRDASHVLRGIEFLESPPSKPVPRNETAAERQIRQGLEAVDREREMDPSFAGAFALLERSVEEERKR